MRKLILTLVFFFIMANLAFAETKVFVEEYTYQASIYDSKNSCRVLALEQVKRLVLEKLGTYLESETEVKNLQLTKDRIVILTAGIVSAEILDERWDGKAYYLRAKITADPNDVYKSIDNLRQDRQKTKELEETRKKADEALREVQRLKKELEIAKAGKIEQDQYNEAINRLSAADWLEKGIALVRTGKWQEAIEPFTKAIELNPKYADAYGLRGASYGKLGDYRQAISNFDKAIELNPKDATAYFGRGAAFSELGDHRQAIRDSNRAIELDPPNAYAYYSRGAIHWKLGQRQQAIRDYDKAIELNPKLAMAYCDRGVAYDSLGDHRQAIRDLDKAIELDPKCARGYYNRGIAYYSLGNHRQAIRDYDKAIEVKPKYAEAYNNRGIAYNNLGDYRQALEDYKIAASLGNKGAQDFLRRQGINW